MTASGGSSGEPTAHDVSRLEVINISATDTSAQF